MFKEHSRQRMVASFTGGVLATGLVFTAQSAEQPARSDEGQGHHRVIKQDFADKVAGTWIDAEFPGYGELRNIHRDGTMLWSNNYEYGAGSGLFKQGAVYGSWVQTGRRTMKSVELGFLYDGDGQHVQTGRVTTSFTFSRDFGSFEAEFVEDIYAADQDPNDPQEVPVESFGGTFTGQRISVSEDQPRQPLSVEDLTKRKHPFMTDAAP